jgi:NHS family xanthosine MFS transporter
MITGLISILFVGYGDIGTFETQCKKSFSEFFALFKKTKMAMFFVFSMLLGASLQLTNMYGDTFLHDFAKIPEYKDLLVIEYPAIIMSISQMSETLFILAIPFFLRRFGIKKVMLMSMIAWVIRFGLFGYGNPADALWMIILSNIVYGMAFDFFNISGSLYVETQTDSSIRASAQGVFMMMTNGFGAIFGSWSSGVIIDHFFLDGNGDYMWKDIWTTFAVYSLIIAVSFAILFKHKHNPNEIGEIAH